MDDEQYRALTDMLYLRQYGRCATCGKALTGKTEVAHRVPRGRLTRRCGKAAEWHPMAVALVCTRKGHDCNDGQLLPIGLPREQLMERIRQDIEAEASR